MFKHVLEQKKKMFSFIFVFMILLLLCSCKKQRDNYSNTYNMYEKVTVDDIYPADDKTICMILDCMNFGKMVYFEIDDNIENDGERKHFIYDINLGQRKELNGPTKWGDKISILPNNQILWVDLNGDTYIIDENGTVLQYTNLLDEIYEREANHNIDIYVDGIVAEYVSGDADYIYVLTTCYGKYSGRYELVLDYNLNLVNSEMNGAELLLERSGYKTRLYKQEKKKYMVWEYKPGTCEMKMVRKDKNQPIHMANSSVIFPGDDLYEYYFSEFNEETKTTNFVGVKNGESYKVFSFEQMGLSLENISYIVGDGQGGYFIGEYNQEEKCIQIISLKKSDQVNNYDVKNGKYTLVVGGVFIGEQIVQLVDGFNMQSDQYYIEIKDYMNDYDDYDDAIRNLNVDMISNSFCDGYFLNGLEVETYAEKGALMKLNDYFECNEIANVFTDQFYRLVTDKNGNIYYLIPCYKLKGLASKEGIDYGNLTDITDRLNENYVFSSYTENILFPTIIQYSGNQYIDIDKKESYILEDDFKDLLLLMKRQKEINKTLNNTVDRYSAGEAHTVSIDMSYPEWYFYYEYFIGRDYVSDFPGGMGLCLDASFYRIAISNKTDCKEGMYEFLNYVTNVETYKKYYKYEGFPVTEDSWVYLKERLLAKDDFYDSNGTYNYVNDIVLGTGDSQYVLEAGSINEEDFDRMRQKVEKAVYIKPIPEKYISIIVEEANYYFEGKISLEEAVHIIDNRIKTALEE